MIGTVASLDVGELDQGVAIESPIAVDAKGAVALFGMGLRTWMTHHSAGRVPRPVHVGGCCRWVVDELRSWAAAGCPGRDRWEQTRAAAQEGSK